MFKRGRSKKGVYRQAHDAYSYIGVPPPPGGASTTSKEGYTVLWKSALQITFLSSWKSALLITLLSSLQYLHWTSKTVSSVLWSRALVMIGIMRATGSVKVYITRNFAIWRYAKISNVIRLNSFQMHCRPTIIFANRSISLLPCLVRQKWLWILS